MISTQIKAFFFGQKRQKH